MSKDARKAILSVFSNSLMVIIKFLAGLITGSAAVLSEAFHTMIDLLASLITFIAVTISKKPASHSFPFGFQKMENVSGSIESLMTIITGVGIIYECIQKLVYFYPISLPWLGMSVMLFGGIVNFIVGSIIYRQAMKDNSVAMKANSIHLFADGSTSFGIGIILLLVWITKIYIIDPIIGIGLGIYVLIEGILMLKEAFPPLLDSNMSTKEENKVIKVIQFFSNNYIKIYHFRTRESGSWNYVEFHMIVSPSMSLDEADKLCDKMEKRIRIAVPRTEVMINVETDMD